MTSRECECLFFLHILVLLLTASQHSLSSWSPWSALVFNEHLFILVGITSSETPVSYSFKEFLRDGVRSKKHSGFPDPMCLAHGATTWKTYNIDERDTYISPFKCEEPSRTFVSMKVVGESLSWRDNIGSVRTKPSASSRVHFRNFIRCSIRHLHIAWADRYFLLLHFVMVCWIVTQVCSRSPRPRRPRERPVST